MNYNDVVKRHFFSPSHVGELSELRSVATVQLGEWGVSDVVRLSATMNEDKQINAIAFKAVGGPYLIAAMSYLCEQLYLQPISAFKKYDVEFMVSLLAIPKTNYHSALLVEDVFLQLFTKLAQQEGDNE